MRILFLSRWFPIPADNGSKIRILNLIKILSCQNQVFLVSFYSDKITEDQLSLIQKYCLSVISIPYRAFQPRRLRAIMGYLSAYPRSEIDTFSEEMQKSIDQITQEQKFEMVISSQIEMAKYALSIKGVPKILEEIETSVIYEGYKGQKNSLNKLRSLLTWWKYSHYVRELLKNFKGCTVVSKREQSALIELVPAFPSIEIIPNGVDLLSLEGEFGLPQPNTLIYSGALSYFANFDAIQYFLEEIIENIIVEIPEVKLSITGKIEDKTIALLPRNNAVKFTGYLKDIRPAVTQSWVTIVPLRIGGGTRLKIIESLALGTPVVSTSKGVEGLELKPEQEILIANTPKEFTASIVRLLKDSVLREKLSINGKKAVAEKYNWQTIGQKFNKFVDRCLESA